MNPAPDLAALIEIVGDDSELQRLLGAEPSDDAFAEACAELGRRRGLGVTSEEVREVLRARTILWHQRHIL